MTFKKSRFFVFILFSIFMVSAAGNAAINGDKISVSLGEKVFIEAR